MGFELPASMKECIYFTRRNTPEMGKVIAWADRPNCPKCKKGKLSKPFDEKEKKFKIRSTAYSCNECEFSIEKVELENELQCKVISTCPKCKHQGQQEVPFKRKAFQGVPAIVFSCKGCGEKFGITKKMKEGKKKNKEDAEMDDDF